MGYCVDIAISASIPSKNVNKCLEAINELHTDENLLKNAHGFGTRKEVKVSSYIWYSWVENPPNGKFPDLQTAFEAWRYKVTIDDKGNLVIDDFNGEKWGDDEIFYDTIAPFVKSGSLIEVRGEDGDTWRHVFENKQVKRQEGRTVYED